MANWGKILSRGNVEDRRSLAPVALGGISLTGLALYLVFNLLSGGDMGDVLGELNQLPLEQQSISTEEYAGEDEYEVFASRVLGSNNEFWVEIFSRNNRQYTPPKLVLFRTSTESACGGASSASGPHYCPLDQTIYLDETFFQELERRFGAKGGDVAEAYVIAHEVGHHIQSELGTLQAAQRPGDNEASIRVELQADCYAGLWANSIKGQGILEQGEISEAMDAAATVGDDRIQDRVSGYINPENWTHGSSEQRVKAFNSGYDSGQPAACNF